MSAETPLYKKLTLRMIVPVALVVCAVGIGLYFFVLRTLSEHAEQEIRASLTRTAKDIFDICDRNFTLLLQSGQMGDAKMVRIRRALTLGMIEDFAKRSDLHIVLYEGDQRVLLTFRNDDTLVAKACKAQRNDSNSKFMIAGKVYYLHHFGFQPWDWHIDLISDTTPFAPLIDRVKTVYALTALVLLLGLSAIILTLDRLLRRPVQRIISAVREKRTPDYKGIQEFEFLSENIGGMMTSLKEHTRWLEHLYTIGTLHRGDDFFQAIARAATEATGLNTVITKAGQEGSGFSIMAVAQVEGCDFQSDHLSGGLPCDLLAQRPEPTLVPYGAAEHFQTYQGLVANKAESYVGHAIADREGRTIGCIHLFGAAREIEEWDVNFIKTVGRMVGSEFELVEKEQEQERIREQMFRSQKLESLGLLAGGVAHDFNNLLMGIQGRASLLLEDCQACQVQSSLREHIEAIEEYVLGASKLTDQLLGFSRGGKYDVKPSDINAVLDHSARLFGRTKKEITIQTDFAADVCTVEIDRRQIEQVFLNLFVNAWHAMPNGGNLMLKTENVHLGKTFADLHNTKPGRYVKISVTDTGTGMDDAILKKIFDPFFTTREMGRGTGLGLAVVYGIIKNHHGLITARSRVGHGSTFTIYLPASDKAILPERVHHEQVVQGTETILVVDDEQMITEVASAMLEKLGYRVIATNDGGHALEIAQTQGGDIDLVILDLIMPGMAGGKVFDRLRQIQPRLPVIIASGYAISGEAEAIMKRGCNGFIQKPFNMSDLSRKVRQILDGAKETASV